MKTVQKFNNKKKIGVDVPEELMLMGVRHMERVLVIHCDFAVLWLQCVYLWLWHYSQLQTRKTAVQRA